MSNFAGKAPEQRPRGCLFYVKRGLLALVMLVVALPVLGIGYETVMAASDDRNFPPPGKRVEVNGHLIHIHCTGQGSPTVVMDAGLGGWSLDWSLVQPEVAQSTRGCTYDRAGMGWSEASSDPRDAQHAVQELHTLLVNSGEQAPFVLVGHSNGGFRVILYANAYPQDIAGVVLVDPTPLATDEEQFAVLSPDEQQELAALIESVEVKPEGGVNIFDLMQSLRPFGVLRLLADTFLEATAYVRVSTDVQPAYLATFNNGTFLPTFSAETQQRDNSIEQARAVASLGDMPLTLLVSSKITTFYSDPLPPELEGRTGELLEKMMRGAQKHMAALSSAGSYEQVSASGHYVLIDRPDAVIQAVQKMILSLRTS